MIAMLGKIGAKLVEASLEKPKLTGFSAKFGYIGPDFRVLSVKTVMKRKSKYVYLQVIVE